jgi:hypothetical protein
MEQYEIRITKKGSTQPQIIRAAVVSAYAAIRRALRLAEAGDMIEVWLGLTCVYLAGHVDFGDDAALRRHGSNGCENCSR